MVFWDVLAHFSMIGFEGETLESLGRIVPKSLMPCTIIEIDGEIADILVEINNTDMRLHVCKESLLITSGDTFVQYI